MAASPCAKRTRRRKLGIGSSQGSFRCGNEKVSGPFCAKHPKGLLGKRVLTPFRFRITHDHIACRLYEPIPSAILLASATRPLAFGLPGPPASACRARKPCERPDRLLQALGALLRDGPPRTVFRRYGSRHGSGLENPGSLWLCPEVKAK